MKQKIASDLGWAAWSVVPMIDYNRKSFIYMQPIINRLEFWESFIIGKIFKQKNFIFIEH